MGRSAHTSVRNDRHAGSALALRGRPFGVERRPPRSGGPALRSTATQPTPAPLEPLGSTSAFRGLLFRLLRLQGWEVECFRSFASGEIVAEARRGPVRIHRTGRTEAAVSTELFKAVAEIEAAA